MTVDLIEFLRARLDEDEQDDRTEVDTFVKNYGPAQLAIELEGAPRGVLARAKRGLAEVAAKRRIIELHGATLPKPHECPRWSLYDPSTTDTGYWPNGQCLTLQLHALPYAGHPDYSAEWAPEG